GRWNYLAGEQLSQWLIISLWAWLAYALCRRDRSVDARASAPAQFTRSIEPIATGLHFLAGASAILAIIDVASRGFELLTVGTGLRATGSYGNPNYLAAFLLIALPISTLRAWL